MKYGNNYIMSKIGKKPIIISQGTEAKIEGNFLKLKGKNGELAVKILPYIKVELKDGVINIFPENDIRQAKANWGTMRSLVNNAVLGVNEDFLKILEIEGVGYRASIENNNLILNIGLSHSVKMLPLEGVKISMEKNLIKISGADKMSVGEMAAKIRAMKKPEPYKGKGIRYQGEYIRRKEGKKAAGATK